MSTNDLSPVSQTPEMKQKTYPLRITPSLRSEVQRLAREELISMNHFITLAIAEKLTRMNSPISLPKKSDGQR